MCPKLGQEVGHGYYFAWIFCNRPTPDREPAVGNLPVRTLGVAEVVCDELAARLPAEVSAIAIPIAAWSAFLFMCIFVVSVLADTLSKGLPSIARLASLGRALFSSH